MFLMLFHPADGTDQSSMSAYGIDAHHVHNFATVKGSVGTVDVLEGVFFDRLSEGHWDDLGKGGI